MVDNDYVEASNLPRQLWHLPEDLGKRKVDSAREKLSERFLGILFESLFLKVDEGNAAALFSAYDMVVDATDTLESKLLFSDIAVREGGLLVSAGATGWRGQVMRIEPGGPCLRCVFSGGGGGGGGGGGILGPMAGLMGFWAASLVHKPLGGGGVGRLYWVDALRWRTGVLHIEKDSRCGCQEGGRKRGG